MYLTGYGVRAKHQDCDVVIVGDSTTLTGLDAKVIEQVTGLKTCNIADGVTLPATVGSHFTLDTYLENNKRPRFIIGMYSPWRFQPQFKPFEDMHEEGMLYGVQYVRNRAFFMGLLKRPAWVARFGVWSGHQLIGELVDRYIPGFRPPKYDTRAQRDSHNGSWTFPLPPQTSCHQVAPNLPAGNIPRWPEAVAAFRQRYGVDGTQVIVNVSPQPDCEIGLEGLRKRTEGLHDNPFETLPVSYFNEGDLHYSPEGSRYISIQAGNQILALERQQDARRQSADGTAP